MKKITKIAAILLMLLTAIFAVAACAASGTISIDSDNPPQTTYVLGQELNRNGAIILKDGSKTEQIALSSPAVSVKGYDKDTLGTQTLTVSYKKLTAKYTVNVVRRIATDSKCTTKYFVGEPFDRTRGSITVTKDDGTSFSVAMSDAAVSVQLDSSSAGTGKLATITYSKDGATYSDTVAVDVYEIENAKLTTSASFKTTYKDYDQTLDLTGGYIVLTGGSLTRNVALTADMVSGYDPTKVTEEHYTQPLKQELTVSYAGKTFPLSVDIYYSDVSIIKKLAAGKLADYDWLNWTDEDEVSQEDGLSAIAAIRLFFGLNTYEVSLITREQIEIIARPASAYAYLLWQQEVEKYKDVFATEYGALYLIAKSYAAAKDAIRPLTDANEPINDYGHLLVNMRREFAETLFIGDDSTIGEFLAYVIDPDNMYKITGRLNEMIPLFEKMQAIPDDWTKEGLADYATTLDEVVDLLKASSFTGYDNRSTYQLLNNWRAKQDFFDILYTYYFQDPTENKSKLNTLANFWMPEEVEKVYEDIFEAFYLAYYAEEMQEDIEYFYALYYDGTNEEEILGILYQVYYTGYDMTEFLRLYRNASNALNDLAAKDADSLERWLFDNVILYEGSVGLSLSRWLNELRLFENYGYLDLMYGMLGNTQFSDLMDHYLDLVEKYYGDGMEEDEHGNWVETDGFSQKIDDFFKEFLAASPLMQYNFLAATNAFYLNPYFPFPAYALGYGILESEEYGALPLYYSVLTEILYPHYYRLLISDAENDPQLELQTYLFDDMMNALEVFAARGDAGSAEDFFSWMDDTDGEDGIITKHGKLTGSSLTNFDNKVGFLYEYLLHIYHFEYNTDKYTDKNGNSKQKLVFSAEYSEWEEKFLSFDAALDAYYSMAGLSQNSSAYYIALFSAVETLDRLATDILNNAPTEVKDAFKYADYYDYLLEGDDAEYRCSLEYAWFSARVYYMSVLKGIKLDGEMLYDLYYETGMRAFTGDIYSLLFANFYYASGYYSAQEAFADKAETVKELLGKFYALDLNVQYDFIFFDSSYHNAMKVYFDYVFDSLDLSTGETQKPGAATASALFDLQRAYIYYKSNEKKSSAATYLKALQDAYGTLELAYAELQGSDQAATFDEYLGTMYTDYVGLYNEVLSGLN